MSVVDRINCVFYLKGAKGGNRLVIGTFMPK